MIRYRDNNSITIRKVDNGFVVEKNGTKEHQEDNLSMGISVFMDVFQLNAYIHKLYQPINSEE